MPNLEGRELGGCKLIRKLGAGGMGEVYLGEQRSLGNRLVAVKVVSPDDSPFQRDVAEDQVRRFQREAALLGTLPHPNILPVHNSGVDGSLLYLVMEYVPDGSLADAIRGTVRHAIDLPVPLPFAVNIISQVAAALQYTHEHGIVHRDVKPGNVLVRVAPDGRWHLLLADFGVARDMDASSQRTQVTGTLTYMAPEQFSAQFSPASDQYALAVMAFQLLSGRPPFEGDLATLTRAHIFEPPPSLRARNPAISPAVEAVIMRALAKDPADRYPSVAEFAAALRVAAGVPEGATTTPEAVAPSLPEPATSASIPSRGTTSDGRLVTGTTTRTVPITRRVSPVRLLVTVVSALGLLIAIAGGSVLVAQRQGEVSAQATRTAAAATTAPTATSTALANAAIVTCAPGTTEAIGLPLTCSPVPPTAVGTPLLADPLPLCDGVGGGWQLESNANRACLPEGLQISPIDASANALACADARTVMMADGFASVRVHWQSGGVALAFRESLGSTTTASGTLIAGYYFLVYPASGHGQPDTYELTALDGAGGSRVIGSAATLAAPLAGDFVLGVAYHGGGFTLYVNGQSLATLTNSTRATGWFGVCTLRGTSIFRDAQVFPQAS